MTSATDVRRATRALRVALAWVCLATGTGAAHAAGDALRFAQDPSTGAVSAIVDGAAAPCQGSTIYPLGAVTVTREGNAIALESTFVIADPAGCPSPPLPYEVSANLGTLDDGAYTVSWRAGPLAAGATLAILDGKLEAGIGLPVPASTPAALALLAAVLALTGVVAPRFPHASARYPR
jgi:hypothetical protein